MGLKKIENLRKSGAITAAEAARRIAQCNMSKKPSQKKGRSKKRPNTIVRQTSSVERSIQNAAVYNKAALMNGKSMFTGTGSIPTGGNPVKAYLKTLVNPMAYMARVPDAFDRATCVFRSISSFSPPIKVDAFNEGRFSFMLKPIFGDTSSPTRYQAAVVNPAAITAGTWDTVDWSVAGNYLSAQQNGRDPRIDINAPFLTTPPPSFYGVEFGITTPDLNNVTLVSGVPGNQTPFANNNGAVPLIYSPAAPAPLTNVGGGKLKLPFGDWNIAIFVKFSVSVLPGAGFEAINLQSVAQPMNVSNIYQPSAVVTSTGVTYEAFATIQATSSPGASQISFNLAPLQTGTTLNPTGSAGANITVTSAVLTLSPANFSTSSTYLSGGVIEEVRPVAMATLVTYMGTTLNDGGQIAISYVPNNAVVNNYLQSNNAGIGQLQKFENLRNLESSYNGALRDGCYCIWAPYSNEDTELVSPETMNGKPYPAIICSGVFSPDTTPTVIQPNIRVEVFVVYEFVTKYTMFEQVHQPGSDAARDAALSSLKGQQFGCKNKDHLKWVKDFLSSAGKFYKDNAVWINPAATVLAGML